MKSFYLLALTIMLPETVSAYVGPGAGLGMIGSFIAVFLTFFAALAGMLYLPLKTAFKHLFRKKDNHD